MDYSHDALIHQDTGEIDWSAVKQFALSRAKKNFGGPKPPPAWLRDELQSLKGMATVIRRRWREAHGMADDVVPVMMNVPTWGCGGDSF